MPRSRLGYGLEERRIAARRWVAGLVVLALILAAGKACAIITRKTNPVDQVITDITSPVVYVLRRTGEGILSLGHVFEVPALLRENGRLKQENQYLSRQADELRTLEEENLSLRSALKLNVPSFQSVAATVIARPYDLWLDSVLIDAGREDGVRLGNLVVNGLGVVGKIVDLDSDSGRVQLITSPGFRLGAVSALSRDEGVVRGVDWRTLLLDYIPAGSKIAAGEKVFTRGEETFPGGDNNCPRGKLIGTVVSRKVDKNGFLEVLVQPAVSPSQLGAVVVLTR